VRGQGHVLAALYPGEEPVPIVQEAGWAPGPVWTGAENLAPSGIRSPDRPARIQSLYQLSYPDLLLYVNYVILFLGAVAKLWKATIGFVILSAIFVRFSVCPLRTTRLFLEGSA
jgi:hypothetical protein